jgi:uncharacterized iron-regulated protein
VLARLAVVLCLVGCAHGATPAPRHGTKAAPDLAAAARPFRALRARGGAEVPLPEFLAELSLARAVCLGESHDNPHHHWLQREIVEHLALRAVFALGLEMIQRPFQGVLDDYAAGRVDPQAFLSRTGWHERWGYDFALYRPILAAAGKHRLLALNAPRELVHKIAQAGLEGLSPVERAALPELDLNDAAHHAFFAEAMKEHQGMGKLDNYYAAQVVWDETMANTAAAWLLTHAEGTMAILAGTGHCMDRAIPARMRRRGIAQVLSVLPIIDDGKGNVAAALARPEHDFLVVMSARSE